VARLDSGPAPGRRRLLVAGSVLYLGLIFGVMLWRGIEIEPQWVALALLVIAVAMGRGRQFIFDFFPFLLLFFAYEVMRGFASKTGFQPHNLSVLELALFGGNLPTLVLQHAFYRPGQIGWLDLVTTYFYFMHFVLPVAAGFVIWLRSRQLYWRFAAALLLLSFLAFVTYLFFPSTPPWLQFPGQVHQIQHETVIKLGLAYYVSPLYTHLDPNLYAAFPSLHAAYPTLAALYVWRAHRKVAMLLCVWAVCVWFSVVYLGEHYVVDVLDGLVYVAVAIAVVELWARKRTVAITSRALRSAITTNRKAG
jgi:membrane-associated phospholipid phosphatase